MVKIKEYMIKRILIYHLLCMLTSSVAYGQTTIIKRQSTTAKKIGGVNNPKRDFCHAYPFNDGLAKVEDEFGCAGFIDVTGKRVTQIKYQRVGNFSEGLAWVQTKDGIGYIDNAGKMVIPCKWWDVGDFHEGLAWVRAGEYKWGYINKTGETVFTKENITNSSDFQNGLAKVRDLKDHYGFMNISGDMVIPFQWENVGDFSEGLAWVPTGEGIGFIDKNGKLAIHGQWAEARDFHEGLAGVRDKSGKWGFIDKTGKLVIPCKWKSAKDFHEGLCWVQNDDGNYVDNYGVINRSGEVIVPCKWSYTNYMEFSEGLSVVEDSNGRFGYIDKTGKIVIPCKYYDAIKFSEGLAWVADGGPRSWHIINPNGKIIY